MPDESYYRHVRREIVSLLPSKMSRVLEVGCGAGETLRWLKDSQPLLETTGVEYNPMMLEPLKRNVDTALIGPIGELMPQLGTYDTILCLDVLEHLVDSEDILRNLAGRLAPGGCMIISLPNISHLSVTLPLLFRRRFPYADAGLLDRTHLRFFTEHLIVEFIASAGLSIDEGRLSGMQGGKARFLNRATFGLLKHYLTKQYIFRCRIGAAHMPVNWKII